MKLKLQPGGKLIIAIVFLVFLYFILSWIGFFGLFSSTGSNVVTDQSPKDSLAKQISIGYTENNFCPGIFFANGGTITTDNSINSKHTNIKTRLFPHQEELKLYDFFLDNSDSNKIKLLVTTLDRFALNYSKLALANPIIFLATEKMDKRNFLIVKSYITHPKLLAKKRIAVIKNSPSHFYLLEILKANNIENKSIKYIYTRNDKESLNKLKSKGASAIIISDPAIYLESRKMKDISILSPAKEISNYQVMIAKSDQYKNYFNTINEIALGILKANDSIIREPDIVKTMLSAYDNSSLFEDFNYSGYYNLLNYRHNEELFTAPSGDSQKPLAICLNTIKQILNQYYNLNLSFDENSIIHEETLSHISIYFKLPIPVMPQNSEYEIPKVIPEKKDSIIPKQLSVKKEKSSKFKEYNPPIPEPVLKKDQLTVYFSPNSFKLDAQAKTQLDAFAKSLSNNTIKIEIHGNTDSTGEDLYNFMLSRWRSKAVADYLNQSQGIDRKQFTLIGNGSRKPVANNAHEKGRRQNRRADIIVKSK